MQQLEELKTWADKWKIPYDIRATATTIEMYFIGPCCYDATFSINKLTGDCIWYGGD